MSYQEIIAKKYFFPEFSFSSFTFLGLKSITSFQVDFCVQCKVRIQFFPFNVGLYFDMFF